jgi:hypothetical protein
LEVDPEQTRRMRSRIAENYLPRQAHQVRPRNNSRMSNKLIDDVLDRLANRKNGLKRLNRAVKQAQQPRAARCCEVRGMEASAWHTRAILIADARAPQVLSVGPVIDQITHRATIEDEHSKLG